MKVELAKSAGFCFGVNRAVELVYKLIGENKKVCTLGPIIHNPIVVKDLEEKGVRTVGSLTDVEIDETLVIRSHGVPKSVIDEIKRLNISYVDATCPYVSKIQKIVAGTEKSDIIIIGDKNHPEVMGIKGNALNNALVVRNSRELEELLEQNSELEEKEIIFVTQTTFSKKEWQKCLKIIKKVCTNAKIFDTICKATEERQREADLLSQRADIMIIIGGRDSSNTKKLFETSKQNCEFTYLVEKADELPIDKMKNSELIGITAGASTPVGIIKEVLKICQNLKLL